MKRLLVFAAVTLLLASALPDEASARRGFGGGAGMRIGGGAFHGGGLRVGGAGFRAAGLGHVGRPGWGVVGRPGWRGPV